MPGAHSYLQYTLTYKFTLTMAQDQWTLQEKGQKVKNRRTGRHCRPVLQLPTGQSLQQTCDDPGAHGMNRGQSKMNRTGQTMRRAVGMAWQRRAGTHSLQNKAAAGEQSRRTICPAQASQKQQPAVGRPLAVQCRLVEGVLWCWHSRGGLRPT